MEDPHTTRSDAPRLTAVPAKGGGWRVFCGHRWNYHGGAGHRTAHCDHPDCQRTGYIVVLPEGGTE